jgi:DNA-binding transcriptional LysR family regulator
VALGAAVLATEVTIDDQSLRAFVTAAHCGRIDHAAEALRYTAPAVSYQIRKLERALGVRLLHRSRNGVRLTPRGAELLSAAEEIIELIDRMHERTVVPRPERHS